MEYRYTRLRCMRRETYKTSLKALIHTDQLLNVITGLFDCSFSYAPTLHVKRCAFAKYRHCNMGSFRV